MMRFTVGATALQAAPDACRGTLPFPEHLAMHTRDEERAAILAAWLMLSLSQQLAISGERWAHGRYAVAMLRGLAITARAMQETPGARRATVPHVCNTFIAATGFRMRYVALAQHSGARAWCRVHVYSYRSRKGRIVRPGHITNGDTVRFTLATLPNGAEVATMIPYDRAPAKFCRSLRLVK